MSLYISHSLSKPRQICAGAQTALATDLRLHGPQPTIWSSVTARSVAVRAAPSSLGDQLPTCGSRTAST